MEKDDTNKEDKYTIEAIRENSLPSIEYKRPTLTRQSTGFINNKSKRGTFTKMNTIQVMMDNKGGVFKNKSHFLSSPYDQFEIKLRSFSQLEDLENESFVNNTETQQETIVKWEKRRYTGNKAEAHRQMFMHTMLSGDDSEDMTFVEIQNQPDHLERNVEILSNHFIFFFSRNLSCTNYA